MSQVPKLRTPATVISVRADMSPYFAARARCCEQSLWQGHTESWLPELDTKPGGEGEGREDTNPEYLQEEVPCGKSQTASRGSLAHVRRLHGVLPPQRPAPLGCREPLTHWSVGPGQPPNGQKPAVPAEALWSTPWCFWRVQMWWHCWRLGPPGDASLGPSFAGLLYPGSDCRGVGPSVWWIQPG